MSPTELVYRHAVQTAKDAIARGERFAPAVVALGRDGQTLLDIPVLDIRQVRSYIRRTIHAEQAQGFLYISDSVLSINHGPTQPALLCIWGDREGGIRGEAWRFDGVAWECIPAPEGILAPYQDLFTIPLASMTDYGIRPPRIP